MSTEEPSPVTVQQRAGHRPERQALIAPAFIAAVGQRQQAINHSVLDAIENRKPGQRDAIWPIEYAL